MIIKLNFYNIPFLLIFFIILLTKEISCVYRQEAYKIFDRFTLVDLVRKLKLFNYLH